MIRSFLYWVASKERFDMADFIRKKLQVFVSSTFSDLIKERQAAVESILTAGHIPAGMELFTPGNESQLEVIKQWIDESDVYLLILGSRYGSIEAKTGKSYTQLEYEYALSRSKPLFACVLKDEALDARVAAQDAKVSALENPQKLKEFRATVLTRMCRFWEDHKDIKITVAETLSHFSRRENLAGWVRPCTQSDLPAIAGELTRLSKENADLRDYSSEFRNLVALYDKAKSVFQNAEQANPSSIKGIVLRELGDFNDHVMRLLRTIHCELPEDINPDEYINAEFVKARSHLLRGAFDSLDAILISSTTQLKESLKGISNEAIFAVYPAYFTKIADFEKMQHTIAAHRRSFPGDGSLSALEAYAGEVEKACDLTNEIIQRVPLFHKWKPSKKTG